MMKVPKKAILLGAGAAVIGGGIFIYIKRQNASEPVAYVSKPTGGSQISSGTAPSGTFNNSTGTYDPAQPETGPETTIEQPDIDPTMVYDEPDTGTLTGNPSGTYNDARVPENPYTQLTFGDDGKYAPPHRYVDDAIMPGTTFRPRI